MRHRGLVAFVVLGACKSQPNAPAVMVVETPPGVAQQEPAVAASRRPERPLATDEIADARDGARYRWVELNGRRWLAENVRFESEGSWCYADDAANCRKLGRLYTWDAAMEACPAGFHVPSEADWEEPLTAAGAMKELLDGGTSGFAIRMGGCRDASGNFKEIGQHFYFWSSTEYDADNKRARIRWNLGDDGLQIATDQKTYGYSVRCVGD